jgi:hypothetical protein
MMIPDLEKKGKDRKAGKHLRLMSAKTRCYWTSVRRMTDMAGGPLRRCQRRTSKGGAQPWTLCDVNRLPHLPFTLTEVRITVPLCERGRHARRAEKAWYLCESRGFVQQNSEDATEIASVNAQCNVIADGCSSGTLGSIVRWAKSNLER